MQFHNVDIGSISVQRDRRIRKEISGEDVGILADSIKRLGLINPVTITRDHVLVAGETRLNACKALLWDTIPAIYIDELDENQLRAIELEENVKRRDLTWQEVAQAVFEYHELSGAQTHSETASRLGLSTRIVDRYIQVHREITSGNERVAAADGIQQATNIIDREFRRHVDNELSRFEETEAPEEKPSPRSKDVFRESFLDWAPKYRGPKFNFIHCDFPYGINHDESEQGGAEQWGGYEDSPETFQALCDTLVKHSANFMLPSAHILFWCSAERVQQSIEFFAPFFRVLRIPLIWHKSDGRGIIADVERRPRHIYETALFMSLGDRRIIKPVGDCYSCPTQKALHLSQKPEPMLRHFFEMIVDENTEMLDPTCGSGTALCAADSLRAKRVVGLDINMDCVEMSQSGLSRARALRAASEAVQ